MRLASQIWAHTHLHKKCDYNKEYYEEKERLIK